MLERPRAEERRLIDDAIEQVLGWSAAVLAGDLQPVMKALHTKRCAGGAAAGETGGPEEPGGARGRERRAAEGASPVPPRSAA